MDKEALRQGLVEKTKLLAIPIDFDGLIAEGLLIKKGAWYQVTDKDKLPEHVLVQANEFKTDENGNTWFKFSNDNKKAKKLDKKLTGES